MCRIRTPVTNTHSWQLACDAADFSAALVCVCRTRWWLRAAASIRCTQPRLSSANAMTPHDSPHGPVSSPWTVRTTNGTLSARAAQTKLNSWWYERYWHVHNVYLCVLTSLFNGYFLLAIKHWTGLLTGYITALDYSLTFSLFWHLHACWMLALHRVVWRPQVTIWSARRVSEMRLSVGTSPVTVRLRATRRPTMRSSRWQCGHERHIWWVAQSATYHAFILCVLYIKMAMSSYRKAYEEQIKSHDQIRWHVTAL